MLAEGFSTSAMERKDQKLPSGCRKKYLAPNVFSQPNGGR